MASTASALREKMVAEAVTHVMSAHNPLSARLAERAGFDGIWASGFELSAAFGMPDASLISMTQHLEMTRAIADAVELPVIADIDTGYGNAINVMHVVRNYEVGHDRRTPRSPCRCSRMTSRPKSRGSTSRSRSRKRR